MLRIFWPHVVDRLFSDLASLARVFFWHEIKGNTGSNRKQFHKGTQ